MIIQFKDIPPPLYIYQVACHCPKAMRTYLELWRVRDCQNKIMILQKNVRTEYLISTAKFRHDILLLVSEGLLNLVEKINKNADTVLEIELVNWDPENEVL